MLCYVWFKLLFDSLPSGWWVGSQLIRILSLAWQGKGWEFTLPERKVHTHIKDARVPHFFSALDFVPVQVQFWVLITRVHGRDKIHLRSSHHVLHIFTSILDDILIVLEGFLVHECHPRNQVLSFAITNYIFFSNSWGKSREGNERNGRLCLRSPCYSLLHCLLSWGGIRKSWSLRLVRRLELPLRSSRAGYA